MAGSSAVIADHEAGDVHRVEIRLDETQTQSISHAAVAVAPNGPSPLDHAFQFTNRGTRSRSTLVTVQQTRLNIKENPAYPCNLRVLETRRWNPGFVTTCHGATVAGLAVDV
jgi:hypothetical protein